MIEFMLISAPRCASTWAANWLTTDNTLCLHDPLNDWHYTDLDGLESAKRLGIADTGVFRFGGWLNAHPAKKVILHRPLDEINASLSDIGLPPISYDEWSMLDDIDGVHCCWRDLFTKPAPIYEFLTGKRFDAERHAELCLIEMQPHFHGLTLNPEVTKRLRGELLNIIKEQ